MEIVARKPLPSNALRASGLTDRVGGALRQVPLRLRILGRRLRNAWFDLPHWVQDFALAIAFLIWLWVGLVVLCA